MLEREQGTRENTPPPPPPPPKKPNFVNVFGIFPRVFFSFYSPSSAHTQPCYQRSSFLNFSFIFVREEKAERKRKGVFFFFAWEKNSGKKPLFVFPPFFCCWAFKLLFFRTQDADPALEARRACGASVTRCSRGTPRGRGCR